MDDSGRTAYAMFNLPVKALRKLARTFSVIAEYLYYSSMYSVPKVEVGTEPKRYFFEIEEASESGRLFRDFFPDRLSIKKAAAETICQHVFDLLGRGPTQPGPAAGRYQPINWHCDFGSGYSWDPNTFFRYIGYGPRPGIEVKIPWELSRFQHLILLGQAYALTGQREYAAEYQNQISDWIENNKVGFGVNWACNMDVAIRAANWLVAGEYFVDAPVLTESFRRNFLASIYEHGRFIKNTLEKDPPATNHYLAGITGLLFIALYCPFFKESGAWKRFCIAELESEIKKQVYSDGCSFEGSTSYHRLALELFFYAAFFAEKAGTVFSPAYHKMLKKMFRFSLYCIKPDGNIPQIGDNDNSRFLVFSARPVLDHTYLLSLAAIYFRDSDFKLRSFPYDEEAFWLFGKVGRETWQGLPCRDSELCSRAFPVAGWYIMRHADNYCFISCGPNGQNGKGGHNHNDKLSFELMLSGEDVVIDPGTYVYTSSPEWRNTFRSTAYHNTLEIDKREQGCISADLFETQSAVECMPCKLRESRDSVEFEGEIKYSENAGTHKRTIVLEKNTGAISIVDDVKNRLPGNVLMSFCLGPSALKYHIVLDSGAFEKMEGFYSKGYGHKDKTVFLRHVFGPCSVFAKKVTIRAKKSEGWDQ